MAKKLDLSFVKAVSDMRGFQAHILDDTDSLVVVDVYAKCWGPCGGLDQYFYNWVLDMEEAGRRVTIVRAEVDGIGALHEYKDNAKPHFLFYVRGELIGSVKGPQLPKIQAIIKQHAQPPVATVRA